MNGAANESDSHMTPDNLFAIMDKAGYSARKAFGAIYGLGLNNEYEIRRFGGSEQAEDGSCLDLESLELLPDDDVLLGYGPDMSLKVEAWPAFELGDVTLRSTRRRRPTRSGSGQRRTGASLHGFASTREMLDLEADKARERAERVRTAGRAK